MQTSHKTLTPVLVLALALTISASAVAMPGSSSAGAANPANPAAPSATPATQPVAISGKVAETFDSGGYTYVVVEKAGQRVWVASRPVKVAIGQEVTFKSGHVIRNFKSNTLGRTFDAIVFTQGLETPPAAAPK